MSHKIKLSSTLRWFCRSEGTTRARLKNNYKFSSVSACLLPFQRLYFCFLAKQFGNLGSAEIVKVFSIDLVIISQQQHKVFLWSCKYLSSYDKAWEKSSGLNLSHKISGLSISSHSIRISLMIFIWNRWMEDRVSIPAQYLCIVCIKWHFRYFY